MSKKSDRNRRERAAAIRAAQERKERNRRLAIYGALGVVLAVIIGIGIFAQSQRDTSGDKAGPAPSGVTDKYALAVGEKSAKLHVVIYEDFLCPFCKELETGTREALRQGVADGKVYVEYRPFAFLNEYSTRALNAFGAVLDQFGPDVALKYHDLLFDEQPDERGAMPNNDFLINLAAKAGADKQKVTPPIQKLKFEQWTVNASDAASKADVHSTPTVIANGKVVPGDGVDVIIPNLLKMIKAQ